MKPAEGSRWGKRLRGRFGKAARPGMIPGAFEPQLTVSNRIPREWQCSARPEEVESRKLLRGRVPRGQVGGVVSKVF